MDHWIKRAPDRWVNLDSVTEIAFRMEADQDTQGGPIVRRLVAYLDTGESGHGLDAKEPFSTALQSLLNDSDGPLTIGADPAVPASDPLLGKVEGAIIDDVVIVKGGRKPVLAIDFRGAAGDCSLVLTIASYRIERYGETK